MQSFTYCSPEGIQAVKDAFRTSGDTEYPMTFAGMWTEDYQTVRDAARTVLPRERGDMLVMRLETSRDPIGRHTLALQGQEEFDAFVDALADGESEGAEDRFGDWLSGMAQTLGIEFI